MKKLLWLLALWPGLALAQPAPYAPGPGPIPGVPASAAMAGVTTANLVCDGATDNAAALQALVTAAAAGNATTVYFPPAANPCMLASDVTVPNGVTLWANPGSVTIKAKAGNTSSPLLLSFSGNATGNLIYGLTLDGGGTSFANTNNVNVVFQSNNVVFDHVTIQNTAGIGVTFSTLVTNSGARDSNFLNVGASYISSFNGTINGTTLTVNSGLSGTIFAGAGVGGAGVVGGTSIVSGSGTSWVVNISQSAGPEAMTTSLERQGIVFCCGTGLDTAGGLSPTTSSISGTAMTTGNSVSGIIGQYVYSGSNGSLPDTKVVSGSGTNWVVSQSQTIASAHLNTALNQGNFVKNSYFLNTALDSISYTQQRNFAAQNNIIVSPGVGGAGIYDHSNDTTTVTGNTIFGNTTNGNCIDLASTFHAVITGNSAKGCGGSGIAYGYGSDATISGNVANNNGQNGLTGEGTSDAGLFMTGALSPVSNVVISANDFSDTQSTPTQRYGVEMQTGSTFANITIDPNNNYSNNVVQPLSSLLAPLPANLTNQTIPVGSTGFSATVTTAVASPGVVGWTAHNLKCLAPVYFSNSGGALPTGLTAFAPVYVTCGTSLTANAFQVSSTEALALAGTSINFTGSQSGTQTGHYQIIPSSGAALDVVGVSLAAGNYLCTGIVIPYYGGSTSLTAAAAWISSTGGSALPYSAGTIVTNLAGVANGLVSWSEAAIVTPQLTLNLPSVHISLTSAGMAVLAFQGTYTISSITLTAGLTCIPSR